MNVILLNDYAYENGGASTVAFWVLRKLSAISDMSIFVYAGMGEFDQSISSLKNVRAYSLKQFDILTDPRRFRAVRKGLWNYEAAAQMERVLSEYSPIDTVIHVHSYQKVLTSSCIHMAKKLGFSVIMHLHDYGMVCPNLAFYDFRQGAVCRRQALGLSCLFTNCDARKCIHKLWRVVRSYVEHLYAGLPDSADAYIAVSRFSASLFQPYLSEDKPCYILPTPSSFESNNDFYPQKNKCFVFIGRLSPEKHPLLLAKCAYKLHIPVIFIGDGPCKEDLLKINPDAVITGWVNKKEVIQYFAMARCAVFPTLLYETQGLAVEEALSCGIPVIVSDVCAATEVVRHGKNGLLFHSNDEKSLKCCLLKMMDDHIVESMSMHAKTLYRERAFLSERYIHDLLNIYKKTLEKYNCQSSA